MSVIKKDIKSLLKASIVVKPLEVIKNFFILKFLTPEMYGLLNIINQISLFAKYGDLGFTSVLAREYNYEVQRDKDKAEYIKNVAYSSELILAILLSVLVFLISFLYIENQIIFIGVISASLMLLISKLSRIYNSYLKITKQFNRFARFNLLSGLIASLGIIALISYIGIYAPLIISVISGAIVISIMFKKIDLNLTFLLERKEVIRQLKLGIALGGLTFFHGVGIYLERFLILDRFGLKEVGFFSFAIFVVTFARFFINDMVSPYIPRVREMMARGDHSAIKDYLLIPSLKMFIISVPVILLLQQIITLLVQEFFLQYIEALQILKVIIWLLIPISMSAFSGYLLISKGVDKWNEAYLSCLLYFVSLITLSYVLLNYYNDFIFLIYAIVFSTLIQISYKQYVIFSFFYNKLYVLLCVISMNLVTIAGVFYA
jgi:O-antigen/teichoic acid export membrane protein